MLWKSNVLCVARLLGKLGLIICALSIAVLISAETTFAVYWLVTGMTIAVSASSTWLIVYVWHSRPEIFVLSVTLVSTMITFYGGMLWLLGIHFGLGILLLGLVHTTIAIKHNIDLLKPGEQGSRRD